MFFNRLAQIAAFDVIEIGEYVNSILDLQPTGPVNEKFETLGLESRYFINNLGTFFVILMLYVLLVFIWVILYLLRKCKDCKILKKLERNLSKRLFWNGLIVVVF